MKKRIMFGAIMIAAVAGLLTGDHFLELEIVKIANRIGPDAHGKIAMLSALAVAALLVPAFLELVRLAAGASVLMLRVSGLMTVLSLGTLPFWWQFTERPLTGGAVLAVMGVLVLVIFVDQLLARPIDDAFRRISCTVMAAAYLGVGGAMILQLRLAFGVPGFAMFLAVVKFTDIGAYFTGKAIGRHKLIPAVSPGKSWEGLVVGVVAAVIVSLAATALLRKFYPACPLSALAWWHAGLFGAVMAVVGQLGDLGESLLKRSAKVKDSGHTVPEFGGVLDILDSLLLAAPAAYAMLLPINRVDILGF